jgi:drug/metabolite transporter (DMT)-like permease
MGVLLALGGALAYGLSDFLGGFAARRTSAWTVAFVGSLAGLAFVALAHLVLGGDPTAADLAWGAAAGVGNGLGTAFLYRGFASGRMGVVGPISSVGAALVPVAVGLLLGERPTHLVWFGIVAAVPGIWMVSQEPGSMETETASSSGVPDGVIAGLGFGSLFACLGQVPDSAGLLPLVVNQTVALLAIVVTATLAHAPWVPRARASLIGVACGGLGATATVFFLLAAQRGQLAVTSVLTALYPAVTILLAATLLKEHVHRLQALGLLLCGCTVTLIAVG